MEPNTILIDTENERLSDLHEVLEFIIENKGAIIDSYVTGSHVMLFASDRQLGRDEKFELYIELVGDPDED